MENIKILLKRFRYYKIYEIEQFIIENFAYVLIFLIIFLVVITSGIKLIKYENYLIETNRDLNKDFAFVQQAIDKENTQTKFISTYILIKAKEEQIHLRITFPRTEFALFTDSWKFNDKVPMPDIAVFTGAQKDYLEINIYILGEFNQNVRWGKAYTTEDMEKYFGDSTYGIRKGKGHSYVAYVVVKPEDSNEEIKELIDNVIKEFADKTNSRPLW